jgi:hypothetical protein
MTQLNKDLYSYLSIFVLIALLILWAWYEGGHAAEGLRKINGQSTWHRAHVLAAQDVGEK